MPGNWPAWFGPGAAGKDPPLGRHLASGLPVLLTHHAISALICQAATAAGIDPDRVKFKRTVRIVRRRAGGLSP